MRRTLFATVLLTLVSGVCFAASPKAASSKAASSTAEPSNESQIQKRTDEFVAAWNKHDPTEMAYLWSADGDLINPAGQKASGLMQIQRLFQAEQSGLMKQSTFKVNSMSVRLIEPTLAIVDADLEVSGVAAPDGTTMTIKPHVINVMRKSGGQWWIVAARAYNFTPPPAPPAK